MKFGNMYLLRSMAAAGCLTLLFSAHALWAQETKEKVTVDDVDRTFMVRLPKGYDATQHYPVVILLHGMNQDPEDMERLTRFNELADKDGIITIYPSALHGRWNVGVRAEERRPTSMGPGRGWTSRRRRLSWRRWLPWRRLSRRRWWLSRRGRRRRIPPGRRTTATPK